MSEAMAVDRVEGERAGTRAVRLRIPAKPEFVALCRLALTGIAQLREISDEALGELKLALTEAVSNSVRHADDGRAGQVEVTYELHADRLRIEVVGDGAGLDPERRPSPECGDPTEDGLGIAIIRTIADELEIESQPGGRGSRLRFSKQLGAR